MKADVRWGFMETTNTTPSTVVCDAGAVTHFDLLHSFPGVTEQADRLLSNRGVDMPQSPDSPPKP